MDYLKYLNDELERSAKVKGEIRGLEGLALEAMREALMDGDLGARMKAAMYVLDKGVIGVEAPKLGMMMHQRMREDEVGVDGKMRGLGGELIGRAELESFVKECIEIEGEVVEEKRRLVDGRK